MDIPELANALTLYLAPFLPYLLKAGEKAAEEAGKKLGEESWNKAKSLWSKLRPKVEAKSSALEAAQDVGESPSDEDALASLHQQVKKLLNIDPSLADELSALLVTNDASIQVIVSGKGGVGVGGDAVGSTIITGDGNAVGNNNSVSVTKTNAVTHGATLSEFTALLSQLREELLRASFDDRVRQVINADVKVIEAETNVDQPNLPLIESKLKGIESLAKSTVGIGTVAMTLVPIVQKVVEYAQVLFR
jgi:hypothetical protein